MQTDVQIINDGIAPLGSSRVRQISPPITPLEVFMAGRYPQWKRSELTKRRWVFAVVTDHPLTQTSSTEAGSRKYKYQLPNDCLRPIRTKTTEWVQKGRYLYSAQSSLSIDYVYDAPESDFDPLFVDVLAARIRWGSCEYITQSQSKKESAKEEYLWSVKEAGKANAFTIGPEDLDEDEGEPSWLEARHGYV